MKLIRIVLRDLQKDAHWILVFGVTGGIILSALFVFMRNYRQVLSQNTALIKLEEEKVWNASVYYNSEMFFGNDRWAPLPRTKSHLLEEYFKKNFNHDGIGGFYYQTGVRDIPCGVTFLTGRKTELTSYDYHYTDGILCLAVREVKSQLGETVLLQGKEYPVELIPDEFKEFRFTDDGGYNSVLYVLCPDFQDFLDCCGNNFQYGDLLFGCVLVDPTEEDRLLFQKTALEGAGYYSTLESIEHYLTTTNTSGERTHEAYVIYFGTVSLALMFAILLNQIRLIRRRFPDYAVHHLCGEPLLHILARMDLYAFGYMLLGLLIFFFFMKRNALSSPFMILISLGVVLLESILVPAVLFRSLKRNIVFDLRRKSG